MIREIGHYPGSAVMAVAILAVPAISILIREIGIIEFRAK
jgi:hypothetical protein